MKSVRITAAICTAGMYLLLSGCATGKGVRDADDIRDDGKRNIAVLTYDINVWVTDRHSGDDETSLSFQCPDDNGPLGGECFTVAVPYKGTKVVDGFGRFAFESSGAKAVSLEYGSYGLSSASYRIVTDRVPETSCTYSKKQKREVCRTRMKDEIERHRASFPEPIAVSVAPGAGCYIGHLELTVIDDEVSEFRLDAESPLTEDDLATLPADLSAAVLRQVSGPCRPDV